MPDTRRVYLPAYISDTFGSPQNEVQKQIWMGDVSVDGESVEIDRDSMDLPYHEVVGKRVIVKGPDRTYDFTVS